MIAQSKKVNCTNFAQVFGHFMTGENSCDIVAAGERILRKERSERLKSEIKNLPMDLKKIENEIANLERESDAEKEMRHLARLIYAGQILEKVGLLYDFNEQSLCEILTANKNKIMKPPE